MSDEVPEDETGETTESKSDAERRLKAAGLHDEATKYRTERRIRYRDSGLTKKESKEKAWADMLSKFPPPGVEPVEPPEIEMPGTDPNEEPVLLSLTESPEPEEDIVHIAASKGSMDVAGDVEWAYNNLNNKHVRADQAPSAGAWNMLIYGREARHKFLELVTRYDVQQKKDEEKDAFAFQDDAVDLTNSLKKLRAITEEIHFESVLDAIRQAPGEVERALRKAGWNVTRPLESTGVEV